MLTILIAFIFAKHNVIFQKLTKFYLIHIKQPERYNPHPFCIFLANFSN